MASLTIRNLTVTPLQLTAFERREGSASGRAFSSTTGRNGPASSRAAATAEIGQQDVQGVVVEPFGTRATDIRAADPRAGEVLRLVFQCVGTAAAAGGGGTPVPVRYTVEVPGQSGKSLVMTREGGGGGGTDDDSDGDGTSGAAPEFTAVYVAAGRSWPCTAARGWRGGWRRCPTGFRSRH